MSTIFYVGILASLWIVNLFNGTGLDSVYHVTTYAKYIITICAVVKFFASAKKRGGLIVSRRDFVVFGGMFSAFLFSALFYENGAQAFDYLWVFFAIFLIESIPVNDRIVAYTGWFYGVAGISILLIYNYGSFLSGWNTNSIAMIGMHSYLVFIIQFFKVKPLENKVIVAVATAAFAALILPTSSRSGILFLVLGMLFALDILPRKFIFYNRIRMLLVFLVPLFVAIVVVGISKGRYMDTLDTWSYIHFQKPIFNGRDMLWDDGFSILSEHLFFGIGNMATKNWHNSAITCLVAFGVVGYCFWISAFRNIYGKVIAYLDDYVVQGCLVSFSVLYLQQTVELGFISATPSILPYVILGILLGRRRYIKTDRKNKSDEAKCNCTSI